MTPSAAKGIMEHAGKLWPEKASGQWQWEPEQWNVVRKAVIRLPEDFYPVAKEALDRLRETTDRVTVTSLCEAINRAHREWAARRVVTRRAEPDREILTPAEKLRLSMEWTRRRVDEGDDSPATAARFERTRSALLDLIARGETEPDPVRDRELGQEVTR